MELSLARPADNSPAPWLLPALAGLLLAVYGVLIATVGPATTLDALRKASLLVALHLAVPLPLLLIAWRTAERGQRELIGWAAAAYALSLLLLYAPRLPLFEAFRWNWQGKLASTLAVVALIAGLRRVTPEELGARWRLNPGSLRPLLAWTGVCAVIFFLGGWDATTTPETLLYQWTMPGLDEELLYRGVLLALLDRAFGTPWRLGGAQIGWGLVLTSALFGAAHAVAFNRDGALELLLVPGVVTGLVGLLLGWVRARTGSLWPAILLHNVINGVSAVAALISGGLA